MDSQSLAVSGASTLSDHYNKTNIDSILVEKSSLANPSCAGTVINPSLTVAMDVTINGSLSVSGTDKIIKVRRIQAPPFNN